jgi:Autographiviridae endonuclease
VKKPFIQRFNERWTPEPWSGCWLWTAGVGTNNYGKFWFNRRRNVAHRVSWQLHRGPIPTGMWVLHKCDTPLCVNPDHLWLGTNGDNQRDSVEKGRQRPSFYRGESLPQSKLTDRDIIAIRKLYRKGVPNNKSEFSSYGLGQRFGVSSSLIRQIIRREIWRHV